MVSARIACTEIECGAAHAVRLAALHPDADALTRALYHDWYLGNSHDDSPPHELPPMVESLAGCFRAAHAGSRLYEPGWTVVQVGHDGTSVVSRNQRHRVIRPAAMIAAGGLVPRPGDSVAVRRLVDDVPTEGGFWHTFSDRAPLDMDGRLSRVYWNTTPASAVALVAAITELLLDADVGWQLKCLTAAQWYSRPDSAVLYLEHHVLCGFATKLAAVHNSLAAGLGVSTPPLARRVAQGLAWAAQPDGDDSFGEHRCRLLASAAAGCNDPTKVAERFAEELCNAGFDPYEPHRPRAMEEPSWPTPS